jgi:hypothetical protein
MNLPTFTAERSLSHEARNNGTVDKATQLARSRGILPQAIDAQGVINIGLGDMQDCYIECLQDCYVDVSLRVSPGNRGTYLMACRNRCHNDCFDPANYAAGGDGDGGGGGGGGRGYAHGHALAIYLDGQCINCD